MASIFKEYTEYDGLGLAELIQSKEVQAEEVLEAAIDQIERINPQVNAVVYKMYDHAKELIQSRRGDGPFEGVPYLLKDLLAAYAGHPTTGSCEFLKDYTPDYNTTLLERHLATGLTPLGKTNAPELGVKGVSESKFRGPCRNPWNLNHTSGGSSGGAGAAVASRMVPVAHGGDGGGSIRIPASCCGIFGLKPSRGASPFGPKKCESWSGLVVEHVLTRSVRDSAAMLDAIKEREIGAAYASPLEGKSFLESLEKRPVKLRIGFTKESLLGQKLDQDCVRAVEEAAMLCEELGHEVSEAKPDFDKEAMRDGYFMAVAANVGADIRNLVNLVGKKSKYGDFEFLNRFLETIGNSFSAVDFVEALQKTQRESHRIGNFFKDYDLLLTSTLGRPPLKIGESDPSFAERAIIHSVNKLPTSKRALKVMIPQLAAKAIEAFPNTQVFNITGQPAMSVPLHWNSEGLPVGVQFASSLGREDLLLRFAHQLEEARPWGDKRPPILV
jgi:amidase